MIFELITYIFSSLINLESLIQLLLSVVFVKKMLDNRTFRRSLDSLKISYCTPIPFSASSGSPVLRFARLVFFGFGCGLNRLKTLSTPDKRTAALVGIA